MPHFVARCDKYPHFKFGVPKLRKSFNARGLDQVSTVLTFTDRVLDTSLLDLTEEEASEAYAVLQKMKDSPPIFGIHIVASTSKPQKAAA